MAEIPHEVQVLIDENFPGDVQPNITVLEHHLEMPIYYKICNNPVKSVYVIDTDCSYFICTHNNETKVFEYDRVRTIASEYEFHFEMESPPVSNIPMFTKVFYLVEYNYFESVGLQSFLINGEHYALCEYIHDLGVESEESEYMVCADNEEYFITERDDNIVLVGIHSGRVIKLTRDLTEAARPPGFGQIYKLPGVYNIVPGVNRFDNIIIKSADTLDDAPLYSTSSDCGKEVVFTDSYNLEQCALKVLEHEYPAPKTTKAALRC